MHKRKQIEEATEALCPVAEKEFPLAEMLKEVLLQNGIGVYLSTKIGQLILLSFGHKKKRN